MNKKRKSPEWKKGFKTGIDVAWKVAEMLTMNPVQQLAAYAKIQDAERLAAGEEKEG